MKLPDVYLVLQAYKHIFKVNISRYISMHEEICLGEYQGQLNTEIHKNRWKKIKHIEEFIHKNIAKNGAISDVYKDCK